MIVTEFKGLKSDEKLLLVLLLGTLEALSQKQITVDEVQSILPRLALNKKINPKIQSLLEESWEFEDVLSLIPDKMEECIKDMKARTLKLLSGYDEYPRDVWLGFALDKFGTSRHKKSD